MKNRAFTMQLVQEHEGLRLRPYFCTENKLTIGWGRNLDDKGISHREAVYLLESDLNECDVDLSRALSSVYHELPYRVQAALIDMRFQLGGAGFRQFKRMIAAIMDGDYKKAASEMRNSKWYEQTPGRVEDLAMILEKH
jgi:lysozyme